jgi:hypothetical protein
MKLTILDFINSPGHKNLYLKLFKLLEKKYELHIIVKKEFYSKDEMSDFQNAIFTEISFFLLDKKGSFISRIRIIFFIILSRIKFKLKKTDFILILGFETITFGLFSFLFPSNKTFLMHHHNIDELNNRIKNYFFSLYSNKFRHITLDKFISKSLSKKYNVNQKLINYINHPIIKSNKPQFHKKNKHKLIKIISLSNSNDINQIQELINLDSIGSFNGKSLSFIIKSLIVNYESKTFKIFSSFLPKYRYQNLIRESNYALMLFPKTFKDRISGVMIDSLSNGLPIIGPNIPSLIEFKKRYPSLIYIYEHISELLTMNLHLNSSKIVDFKKLYLNHSDKLIEIQLTKIFPLNIGINPINE